jgi:hypothetical protein
MRRILTVILCFTSLTFMLSSCGGGNRLSNYIPFTRDLKAKLEKDNIDLRQVQFYVNQKIVLSRNLGDQALAVHSGVVKIENGVYINEVVIPFLTPGVCDNVEGDKLMVSFEKGNNDLAFGPGSGYNYNNYVIYGADWKNGTTLVNYDAQKYRARCGSCADIASATLVIRKRQLDKMDKKVRTVSGRTVMR